MLIYIFKFSYLILKVPYTRVRDQRRTLACESFGGKQNLKFPKDFADCKMVPQNDLFSDIEIVFKFSIFVLILQPKKDIEIESIY